MSVPVSGHPQSRERSVAVTGPTAKTAALIIIDVQKGFDEPSLGRRNNPESEDNISDLLSYWRRSGLPIFHVRHLSVEEGPFALYLDAI